MDGADGLSAPIHNMANMPIETVEAEQPLLIEQYALVPDTGGPGRYRGGMAIVRDYRVLMDDTTFQLRSDRTVFVPWGIEGGKGGTPTANYLNPNGENRELPGKTLMKLKKGDLYRLVQASGGGYGDPLDRELTAVVDDVRQEKMTPGHARQEYGVVLDPETLTVDVAASKALRAKLRATHQVSVPQQP